MYLVSMLYDALILTLDERPNIGRQILAESVLIRLFCEILAAFALGQNGGFVHPGDRRLDVDPGTM